MHTVEEFSTLFRTYVTNVLELLKKGRPTEAKNANDADTVDGHSLVSFRKDVDDEIKAHEDAWNPHELSAWYLDAPSKQEVNEAYMKAIPPNSFPVSYFLKKDEDTPWYTVTDKSSDSFTVKLNDWPCVLSGTLHILPAQELTLKEPAKVYAKLVRGKPSYLIKTDGISLAESHTQMYLGTITPEGLDLSKEDKEIVRIDLYRYSTRPIGSAIPIIKGWDKDTDTPKMDEKWYPRPGQIFVDVNSQYEYYEFIVPRGYYSLLMLAPGNDSVQIKLKNDLVRDYYRPPTVGLPGKLLKGRVYFGRPTRLKVRLTRTRAPGSFAPILDFDATSENTLSYISGSTNLYRVNDNGSTEAVIVENINGTGKDGRSTIISSQTYPRPYVKDGVIMVPANEDEAANVKTTAKKESDPRSRIVMDLPRYVEGKSQNQTVVMSNLTDAYQYNIVTSAMAADFAGHYRDVMASVDKDIMHGFTNGTLSSVEGWDSDSRNYSASVMIALDGDTWCAVSPHAPGGFGCGANRDESKYFGVINHIWSGDEHCNGYGWGAGAVQYSRGVPGFVSLVPL